MTRTLVTGCAGFIGSHLVEQLLADGGEVAGVDAFTDSYAPSLKRAAIEPSLGSGAFELFEVDLAADDLDPLLEGVTGVFHLAAQPGVRASWSAFDVYLRHNLLAAQRLFDAAAHRQIRVVLASSSSVYGTATALPIGEDARCLPISPYGVTKLACEQLAGTYAAETGLDVVRLRYFTVYGPRQRPDMAMSRLVRALSDGQTFEVHGDGHQSRDFTYVSDAVAATIRSMESAPPGAVYNVGGGTEASLREIISMLEELAARTMQVRYGQRAPGDVQRTLADTSRAHSELGWQPVTDLRRGLAAQLHASEAISHSSPS